MQKRLSAKRVIEAILKALPLVRTAPEGLEDTLQRMLENGTPVLDRERLNIILSFWRLNPVTEAFFSHYFPEAIVHESTLVKGVHNFIRDALWYFGDIRRAYHIFCDTASVGALIREHQFDQAQFANRLPWKLVKDIPPLERGYLGYVSGQRPYREKELLDTTEQIIAELDQNRSEYEALTPLEIEQRLLPKISGLDAPKLAELQDVVDLEGADLFALSEINSNRDKLEKLREEVGATIKKVEQLKEVGTANQVHYLRNVETIDVYVATSMRDDREYIEMADFCQKVFSSEDVAPLNLRYFDPTLCYCESRIDKGIIECLLVRTSKVTIYCAQEGDTFGKDSELAATLCQGKPVIVYVPTAPDDPALNAKLDKRAKVFQEFHPLSLQVGIMDGVARGVIVVRSAEQCARILTKILTNTLDVEVHFLEHGIVLTEKETKCIVRVMTGWGELAHAFWNNFGASMSPRSGVPR